MQRVTYTSYEEQSACKSFMSGSVAFYLPTNTKNKLRSLYFYFTTPFPLKIQIETSTKMYTPFLI